MWRSDCENYLENREVIVIGYYFLKTIKSAIHVARLTIHEVDVRYHHDFSDKLVEDRRWQTR